MPRTYTHEDRRPGPTGCGERTSRTGSAIRSPLPCRPCPGRRRWVVEPAPIPT